MKNPTKPKGFENDLGDYRAVSFDSDCGEPVSWGFEILNRLGDERFAELRSKHSLRVIDRNPYNTRWAVIVNDLTLDEAIAKYGPVTKLKVGPRGGQRSIQFTKKVSELGRGYDWDDPVEFFSGNIVGDFSTIPENLVEVER